MCGVAHERTILCGNNLTRPLIVLKLWDEVNPLICDPLLPAARRSLGADHNLTLLLSQNLATALHQNPTATRDDLRLNQWASTRIS